MITLVVSPRDLGAEECVVEGRAYRHLFRARRMAVGDELRLVDGQGRARLSRVARVDSRSASLVLAGPVPANEPAHRVELLVPIPRSSRLAWMVEKTTEIGVAAIRLIHTERGPRGAEGLQLERLRRIAVGAVEQSHRSLVPEITGTHAFEEVPDLLQGFHQRWVLQWGAGDAPRAAVTGDCALLVGPEGGWTAEELRVLRTAGCRTLGLGPTVLRLETAAMVGCATFLIVPTADSEALH